MKPIEPALEHTIQTVDKPHGGVSIGLLGWMSSTNSFAPAWWSPSRDVFLRDFWKGIDHVAGSIYTMQARLTTIPLKVVPKDRSIRRHVDQAQAYTETLLYNSEFGAGWVSFFEQQVEDLLCQDNGRFAEIIAPGEPDGPITGMPIGIAHLDAGRCVRTGNPEYPVVYQNDDGKRYKLHYTRVMFDSQMPSPRREMNGVGVSAMSRMLNVAQNMLDILIYKQEKLGSRPHRQLMITRGGLDPDELVQAFQAAESSMTNQGLTRYAKTVVVGDSTLPEASLEQHDLASLPDGFNQEEEVAVGMAIIALALGVDVRELFPMMGGGTRADALLSHMKQRGKGLGQIIIKTENLFNHKFLPPHLMLEFDYQDDTQDRQAAEIRETRSLARERNIATSVITVRAGREDMLENGEITQAQFDDMELQDGRLSDGTSVLALFASDDPALLEFLTIPGVENPLDVKGNHVRVEEVLEGISMATVAIYKAQMERSQNVRRLARQAEMAMQHLKKLYLEKTEEAIDPHVGEEESPEDGEQIYPNPDREYRLPRAENRLMDEEERAAHEEPQMQRNDLDAKELKMQFAESLAAFNAAIKGELDE